MATDALRDTKPIRRCDNRRCNRVLLPADEARGRCALCGYLLLRLPAMGPGSARLDHNQLPIMAEITSEVTP